MFATEWYGVDGVPGSVAARPAGSTAENALATGSPIVRWVMLAHDRRRGRRGAAARQPARARRPRPTRALLVAVLGAVSAVLLIYRVLIVLPSANAVVDQKLGALLGLLAAVGIALGRL